MNENLNSWLSPLDAAKVECDGFARLASTLLAAAGIEYQVFKGALLVHGVGTIQPHWYLQLADGSICDFRARMWLGNDECVPHGVFHPSKSQSYIPHQELHLRSLDGVLFEILSGRPLASFFPCPLPAVPARPHVAP